MANENRAFEPSQPLTPPARKAGSSNVTPIRGEAQRVESLHDPSLDYQPPNPLLVVGRLNFTMKLLAAVVSIILFAGVIWLMFDNWMLPGQRQPGAEKSKPGLQQRIP